MPTGGRRKKTTCKGPAPGAIAAIPKWIVAPGGIGHAVKFPGPGPPGSAYTWCHRSGFEGGHFTAATPERICTQCQESGWDQAAAPPAPEETQGLLF